MLDSGNNFRVCMSKSLADQLGITPAQLRPMPGLTDLGTAAEGAQLAVLGETKEKLTLNLGGNTNNIACRPVVLDNLTMDLNLSGPFMKKHGIDLIQTQGIARFQGQDLPLVTESEDVCTRKGTYSMIYTRENVKLRPMEAAWIPAVAPAVSEGSMLTDHLLIAGDGQFAEKFDLHPMTHSIVDCDKNGRLSVLALNTTGHEIKVKAGSLYGAGFGTTTPAKMMKERDKVCIIEQKDKKPWVREPSICNINIQNESINRGRWKEGQARQQEKKSEKPENLGLHDKVQQYMEGEREIPGWMRGPNTKHNRQKRIGFLLEYFKLRDNPVLKDNKDRSDAVALLLKYFDIFAFDGDYGHTDLMEHCIDVEPGTQPIYEKYRPPNPLLEESMKKQLDLWLKHGVIQPSNSPWNFNLLAAVKKGLKIRWCCDWRKLNRVSLKDRFPIGNCDLNLSKLGGSRIYSTLDAMGAFHCISIRRKDREKTSFSTPWGTYMFARMGFGLCNAPSSYARLVAMVLRGIPMSLAIPFLDDLIIHSSTVAAHISSMETVFRAYRRSNLRLNPRKCSLFSRTAEYLGHKVTPDGISPTKDYIDVVKNWPFPRTRTALRQWIGKASYYRKFIRDFAGIAKPLLEKLGKDTGLKDNEEYPETPEMRKSFEELKRRLISAPILAYPDFTDLDNRPFILYTDWSGVNNSVGGVLCQEDKNGNERVISYAARRLNKSQRNYSATKGELCGILTMFDIFRYFLQFHEFTLRTDHHALKFLQSFKEPTGLFARWQARLENFQFKIQHWPGEKNVVADALSRAPHLVHDPKDDIDVFDEKEDIQTLNSIRAIEMDYGRWSPRSIREAQEEDDDLRQLRRLIMQGRKPSKEAVDGASIDLKTYYGMFDSLFVDKRGVLRYKYQLGSTAFHEKPPSRDLIVLTAEMAADAVRLVHEKGAHMAAESTVVRAMRHVFALNLGAITKRVISKCIKCQQSRGRPKPQRHTLYSTVQGYPWQRVLLDYVGPLARSTRGNRYLLTVQDAFSRYLEAFPVASATAKKTLDILTREVFARYGLPESIHSDRGGTFVAGIVRDVCDALHIVQSTTVPYNPQNNRIERHHKTLGKMLTTLTEGKQHLWEEMLPFALFAHRTHVNKTTGQAPYALMFNHDPRTELDIIFQKPTDETNYKTYEDYAEAYKARMLRAHAWAREHIGEAVRRQRRAYCQARKVYQVGERVWLFSPRNKVGESSKWKIRWTGPWTIRSKINDLTYELAPHPSWPRQRYEKVGIDRLQHYVAAEEDQDGGGTPPATDEDLTMMGDEQAEDIGEGPPKSNDDDDDDDDDDEEYAFPGFHPLLEPEAPPQPQPPDPAPAPLPQQPEAAPRTPPRHGAQAQERDEPPDVFYTPPAQITPPQRGAEGGRAQVRGEHEHGEARGRDPRRGTSLKLKEEAYREEKRKRDEERDREKEKRYAEREERIRRREQRKE